MGPASWLLVQFRYIALRYPQHRPISIVLSKQNTQLQFVPTTSNNRTSATRSPSYLQHSSNHHLEDDQQKQIASASPPLDAGSRRNPSSHSGTQFDRGVIIICFINCLGLCSVVLIVQHSKLFSSHSFQICFRFIGFVYRLEWATTESHRSTRSTTASLVPRSPSTSRNA